MECKLKNKKNEMEVCKLNTSNMTLNQNKPSNQNNSKKNNMIKENCKIDNNECSLIKNMMSEKEKFAIKLYRNLFNYENGVHELVYTDFDLKNKKIFLKNNIFDKHKGFVLFYAPWCTHCKHFKKDYENLAIDYIQIFPFGAVNVENVKGENDKLRAVAKVESVPQLKFINEGGYLENFQSEYTYDDLLYFINMNL